MRDLEKLIKKIELVIRQYLAIRLGIDDDLVEEDGIEAILASLEKDINSYSGKVSRRSASKNENIVSGAVETVASTFKYVYGTLITTYRHVTNTDSSYRIPTLQWLHAIQKQFQIYYDNYLKLRTPGEIALYAMNLKLEIRSFFYQIQQILEIEADDKKAEPIIYCGKTYKIYGLYRNQSELGVLFREHIVGEFSAEALLETFEDTYVKRSEDMKRIAKVAIAQVKKLEKVKSEQTKSEISQLKETVRVLTAQLESTNLNVEHYQQELQESKSRFEKLQHDIQEKVEQSEIHAREIAKLVAEKSTIEKLLEEQSGTDKKQRSALEKQLADMRMQLDSVEQGRKEALFEQERLSQVVQREQHKQQQLYIQLDRAQERHAEVLKVQETVFESPNAKGQVASEDSDSDEYDINGLQAALRNYAATAAISVSQAEAVDDPAELDVDKLGTALKRLATSGVVDINERVPPGDNYIMVAENELRQLLQHLNIHQNRVFPVYVEPEHKGLLHAQHLVLSGDVNKLKELLRKHPDKVNEICHGVIGSLGQKSLLEIALLEVSTVRVTKRNRLAVLELILDCHPVTAAESADPHVRHDLLDVINERIKAGNSVDDSMKLAYCRYALSQRTCVQSALNELILMMRQVESTFLELKNIPRDIFLFDNQTAGQIYDDLNDAVNACLKLYFAYIEGQYEQLSAFLKRENPLPNAECYEVLGDGVEKKDIDKVYLEKFKRIDLRSQLLSEIEPKLARAKMLNFGNKVLGIAHEGQSFNFELSASDEALIKQNAAEVNASKSDKPVYHPGYVSSVKNYTEMMENIICILNRYGAVFLTGGLNKYQMSELFIQRQLWLDQYKKDLSSAYLAAGHGAGRFKYAK